MSDKNGITPVHGTTISVGSGENKKIVVTTPATRITSGGKIIKGDSLLDVVFVFDTTGSMDDKIEALIQTCTQFVDEAKSLDLSSKFALVSFGDIRVEGGGDRIELVISPTEDVQEIKHGLVHVPRNNGFGNIGESSLEAIQEALKIPHRPGAVKVLILITDEPAHQHNIKAIDMTRTLSEKEFLVFVVSPPEPYYIEMAKQNGGIWKEIGTTTNLDEILEMFRNLAKKVSEVAQEVHLLADGSVKDYLRLKPPR
jgi:hypothetical protein